MARTDRGPDIANPPTGSALILPDRAEHNLGFSHALVHFLVFSGLESGVDITSVARSVQGFVFCIQGHSYL